MQKAILVESLSELWERLSRSSAGREMTLLSLQRYEVLSTPHSLAFDPCSLRVVGKRRNLVDAYLPFLGDNIPDR